MKYTVRFTAPARRQLRTVSRPWAMRILAALTELGEDPYRPDADVKKISGTIDLYRLRVGNYRVAYEIHDDELIIVVIRVGDRRDVYRRL